MKISPAASIPTIQNPTQGVSDKIARAKAIAANQTPPEQTEKDVVNQGEPTTFSTRRIKMKTNHTVHRNGDLPIAEGTEISTKEPEKKAEAVVETAQTEPKVGVSDTPVETKSELGDTKPISPELAELARQRRALQVKERELAEKEKALQTKEPEGYIKLQDLQTNILGTLQKHGFEDVYQRLTDEILGQQSQPDLTKIEEKILKQVEERLAGKDKAQEQAVYDYMQQNVERMARNNIAYRLIRETKSEPRVMELVKRMWEENQEILDEEEAMGLIEAELREEAKTYAKLMSGEENEAQTAPKVPSAAPVKTLTNKDSARPAMTRRQRAIAAMLGHKTL